MDLGCLKFEPVVVLSWKWGFGSGNAKPKTPKENFEPKPK